MKALTEYSWPGNVRELENVIERLVVTVTGPMIEVDHLPSEIRSYDARAAATRSANAAARWPTICTSG